MKIGQKSLVTTVFLVATLLLLSLAPGSRPLSVQAAGSVGIRVESGRTSVSAGDVFEFSIWIDAGGEQVMAVDTAFDFDPAYLEVVDSKGAPLAASVLTPGPALSFVLGGRNVADNTAGTVDYSAGVALGAGVQPATGSFLLASGYLRAKADTRGTMVLPHNDASNPMDYRNLVIAGQSGELGKSVGTVAIVQVGSLPLDYVLYYGVNSTLNGRSLPVGGRVTTCGPQGANCAEATVRSPGAYGPIALSAAQAGDAVTFKVNATSAQTLGPDEAQWTRAGDRKRVEIAAGQPPSPTPVPTATSAPATRTSTPIPPTSTPRPASTATRVASPTSLAATATPAAGSSPAATATPAGSQAAPTNTPSSAGQSSPVPPGPEATRPPGSVSTASPAGSPTPGVEPGNTAPTPTAGAGPASTPVAPVGSDQPARLPVDSSTPGNPSAGPDPADAEVAGSSQGGDIVTFVLGTSIVLVIVAGLVVVRRRFS